MMYHWHMNLFSSLVAVDMSTDLTRFYFVSEERQVELTSPSVFKVDRVIDERQMGAFLRDAIVNSSQQKLMLAEPKILAAVGASLTQVEKNAFAETLFFAGVNEFQLVAKSVAAAFGAGVDLSSTHATVLLSCNQDSSELAVILAGQQILAEELSISLADLSIHLVQAIENEFEVEVNRDEIGELLMLSSPFLESSSNYRLTGKWLRLGKIKGVEIPYEFIAKTARQFLDQELIKIEKILSGMDSALATDIVEQGMILYGKLAELKGLPLYMSSRLSFPVSSAPEPQAIVLKGLKEMISSISFQEFDQDNDFVQVLGS